MSATSSSRREDYQVTLRAGIGLRFASSTPANEDIRPEGLEFGFDMDWQISERQKLHVDTTIFPDLDDTGEFRTLSNVAWSMLIDEERNISLNAGLANEYQSQVAAGREHNDLRIFAGLQIDFWSNHRGPMCRTLRTSAIAPTGPHGLTSSASRIKVRINGFHF